MCVNTAQLQLPVIHTVPYIVVLCLPHLQVVDSLEQLGPALASGHGSSRFPRTLELLRRLLSSALDLRTLQEAYRCVQCT